MAKPDNGSRFQDLETDPTPYKIQEFNEADYKDRILNSQFNSGKSKKDKRKFDKYINSEEGKKAMLVAKQRHDASEQSTAQAYSQAAATINKFKDDVSKISKATTAYEQNFWNENKDALKKQGWSYTPDANSAWGGKWSKQTQAAPVVTTETEQPVLPPKVDWSAIATQYGFKDTDAVKAWQAENGLVADGKFGKNSLAKYQAIATANQDAALVNPQSPNPPIEPVSETPLLTVQDYKDNKFFRGVHGMVDDAAVTIDGKKYPIFVINNRYTGPGKSKEENDRTYAVDPETGKMRRVFENWLGMPYNAWSTDPGGEDWFYPSWMAGPEYEWKKTHPMPTRTQPRGGLTPEYEAWLKEYNVAKAAGFKKQGGTMNRINYFQQGGAAPQQDMQQQVVALVQAAMQGDEKATQTVNKIMEAAKAGDQQAVQLAQMIQQVAKQMQGQATAAKWGARLNYIKSLKLANGGKTCPTCKAGAPIPQDKAYIKPTKKVEMKACGGKKAKKRYFGGLI